MCAKRGHFIDSTAFAIVKLLTMSTNVLNAVPNTFSTSDGSGKVSEFAFRAINTPINAVKNITSLAKNTHNS